MNEPRVYICIVNYNSYKETIACIESLLELAYSNFSIVIVDNASTNDSSKRIVNFLTRLEVDFECFKDTNFTKSDKRIVFIQSAHNGGYAAGNNLAIRFANLHRYDYIWVLNNDAVVKNDALRRFVHCARESKEKVGIWGNVLYYHDTNTLQGIGGIYNKFIAQSRTLGYLQKDHKKVCKEKEKVDYPIGASLLFSRDFLEAVGMLNETYFLFFEEMDIVKRAKNMGWDFDICCESIVWHKESVSIKSAGNYTDSIRLKNRFKFTKRYFPCYLPFVVASFLPVLLNRIRRGKWDVVRGLFR